MPRDFTPGERLEILRAGDKLRTWSSLDDERICMLCQRILNGWQIQILRDQRGRYLLKCPTPDCAAFAAHWRHVGDAATVYATAHAHSYNLPASIPWVMPLPESPVTT